MDATAATEVTQELTNEVTVMDKPVAIKKKYSYKDKRKGRKRTYVKTTKYWTFRLRRDKECKWEEDLKNMEHTQYVIYAPRDVEGVTTLYGIVRTIKGRRVKQMKSMYRIPIEFTHLDYREFEKQREDLLNPPYGKAIEWGVLCNPIGRLRKDEDPTERQMAIVRNSIHKDLHDAQMERHRIKKEYTNKTMQQDILMGNL